ncbi:putative uncharacterized protein [Faecalibacterium sp. CAG:1138]|nr:putative uncharacterized protein [Faecalibacterium sp. CAG:1138]
MAVYDDKTSGIIKAGDRDNCFIISNVKSRTEAVFKASYIVASSMRVSGKITALFDLIVLGDVEADDIEVKGKFICMGDCTVENSIIVQDKMFVKQVKAKNIEVHDQITAQEIDVDVIKADGNIIVGQTLATEELAFSEQNILCGETAYGAGQISANSIITVEELDMDDGEDAVVEPNKIVFEGKKSERNFDYGKKYIDKNDYEAYFTDLWAECDDVMQYNIVRWRRALSEVEKIVKGKELECFDLGLLLTLTEINFSSYFKGWDTISQWWNRLFKHFDSIANGEGLGVEKKISMADFTINQRVRHDKYGTGKVTGTRKASGETMADIMFDGGKTISFKLDIAIKFFSLEKESKYTPEELKEKLFIAPIEYGEWLAFLSIMEMYDHMYSPNLNKILNDLLYSKIGLKTKFIEERIKDNGWNE